jgi:hypothetical protein
LVREFEVIFVRFIPILWEISFYSCFIRGIQGICEHIAYKSTSNWYQEPTILWGGRLCPRIIPSTLQIFGSKFSRFLRNFASFVLTRLLSFSGDSFFEI